MQRRKLSPNALLVMSCNPTSWEELIRCHEFAASIMKNCPAVSQERVDLRHLLRAVKPRVDLPHLLRACLKRIAGNRLSRPGERRPIATAGRKLSCRIKLGSSKVQRQVTSSRRRMGRLRKNCRRKKASSHCSWSRPALPARFEPRDLRHCRAGCMANRLREKTELVKRGRKRAIRRQPYASLCP